MKNALFLFIVLSLIVFSGCKSNEEKAAELIRNELSKNLYDYDSYEPIETVVTEAFQTPYNDLGCFLKAIIIANQMKEVNGVMKEIESSKRHMEIWGPPTYYSSSYSDSQYYKYRDEVKKKLKEAEGQFKIIKVMGEMLQDSIKGLDSCKIVGWEVKHRFRCKTKGGMSTIGNYRYIIDKDFKKIILNEDIDSEDYSHSREVLEMAEKSGFESLEF